ncbi:MAG TPA: hypothetical protein VIK60_06960 [Vicinamibacterales bacterium]
MFDMAGVFDLFYLLIAALLVTIVALMVRAMRLTKASIARASRDIPLSRPDVVRRVVDHMRSVDVRCPRCGQPTFAMLGTRNRYKCENDMCRFELEGPEHFPTDVV